MSKTLFIVTSLKLPLEHCWSNNIFLSFRMNE
jgi:hypothetical protein